MWKGGADGKGKDPKSWESRMGVERLGMGVAEKFILESRGPEGKTRQGTPRSQVGPGDLSPWNSMEGGCGTSEEVKGTGGRLGQERNAGGQTRVHRWIWGWGGGEKWGTTPGLWFVAERTMVPALSH